MSALNWIQLKRSQIEYMVKHGNTFIVYVHQFRGMNQNGKAWNEQDVALLRWSIIIVFFFRCPEAKSGKSHNFGSYFICIGQLIDWPLMTERHIIIIRWQTMVAHSIYLPRSNIRIRISQMLLEKRHETRTKWYY